MRLGLPLPFAAWMEKCSCGKQLDREGYHLITCKTGGGPVWTHNTIVGAWSECLRHLHIVHKKEPKHRYLESEDRPDIVAVDPETGGDKELDVSMAHPWALDVVSNAAAVDGAAAYRREELKRSLYRSKSLPGGVAPNFVPLVMEHFGRWGMDAQNFLNQLSLIKKHVNLANSVQNFKSYWRTRFSVALQTV